MKTPKGEVDDRILELLNHEELLTQMSKAKSPQECYDMIKDTVHISFDKFTASMTIAKEYLDESAEGLLTDEELDMVAGGKNAAIGGAIGGSLAGGIVLVVSAGAAAVA